MGGKRANAFPGGGGGGYFLEPLIIDLFNYDDILTLTNNANCLWLY